MIESISSPHRFSFLLGAGVSRPSGGPTVEFLTKRVLGGAWYSHTDMAFYPRPAEEGLQSDEVAERAQSLVRILHGHIVDHIRERYRRPPNYEDYFACLMQIVQDETTEIVNPLICDNVARLKEASFHLYKDGEYHIDQNKFASLADRSANLIQHVVLNALRPLKNSVGFELLGDTICRAGSVDVFTLNHDLLIERYLKRENIAYTDGFGEKDGDVWPFAWAWNSFDGLVHLLKLHGSIDWYRVRRDDIGVDQFVRMNGGLFDARDAAGKPLSPLEVIPNFLTGTVVKEQAYGVSLFGDIFEHFRKRLRATNTLICSGYGWEDKGINSRIRQWLYDSVENRVVILHGSDGEPLNEKRFWYWYWNEFVACGKVVHIQKWFSDCTFDDIQSALFASGQTKPFIFRNAAVGDG